MSPETVRDSADGTEENLVLGPVRRVSEREVKGEIGIGSRSYEIHFRSGQCPLAANTEAFLACGLLPFMSVGGTVAGDGEISRRVLAALPTIQDVHASWDSSRRRITLQGLTPISRRPPAGADRVGAFFSGGIDSFYTLLKHREEITDLILIRDFEVALSDPAMYTEVLGRVREVAERFGQRVVVLETNVRELLNAYVNWGEMGFGAALLSAGLTLSTVFRRIYVAGSYSYVELYPLGSHPLLDPLWSSEALEFVHDGCEATRSQKLGFIGKFDMVLKNLRVCRRAAGEGFLNCGYCEKCVRTMLQLHAHGLLRRTPTFQAPLEPGRVSSIDPRTPGQRAVYKQTLAEMKDRPEDAALRRALRRALRGSSWPRRLLRKVYLRLHRKPGRASSLDSYVEFVGPAASGKTTLARGLAQVLRARGAEVRCRWEMPPDRITHALLVVLALPRVGLRLLQAHVGKHGWRFASAVRAGRNASWLEHCHRASRQGTALIADDGPVNWLTTSLGPDAAALIPSLYARATRRRVVLASVETPAGVCAQRRAARVRSGLRRRDFGRSSQANAKAQFGDLRQETRRRILERLASLPGFIVVRVDGSRPADEGVGAILQALAPDPPGAGGREEARPDS